MESDWKRFSKIIPELRERYLAERNARFVAMLTDPSKTDTARFWDALEAMKKEAKVLQQCLDGHSRSKMLTHMMLMARAGMLRAADLAQFSEELQKRVSEFVAVYES